MSELSIERLIPEMEAYKRYLAVQEPGKNTRPLSNIKEDYKRRIAKRASKILNAEEWTTDEIGTGVILERASEAVNGNGNLVGRFQ